MSSEVFFNIKNTLLGKQHNISVVSGSPATIDMRGWDGVGRGNDELISVVSDGPGVRKLSCEVPAETGPVWDDRTALSFWNGMGAIPFPGPGWWDTDHYVAATTYESMLGLKNTFPITKYDRVRMTITRSSTNNLKFGIYIIGNMGVYDEQYIPWNAEGIYEFDLSLITANLDYIQIQCNDSSGFSVTKIEFLPGS